MTSQGEPTHILYHHPYSIFSIMARYTFACRGAPKDSKHEMRLKEEVVDIMHGGQLSEHYLCDVNAKGEVPVLAPLPDGKPLPDSLNITYAFAESYPAILPSEHGAEIKKLLEELHQISVYSLTFTGNPTSQLKAKEELQNRLKDESNSPRYCKAMEKKIER
jgi:glutathione S-transferase